MRTTVAIVVVLLACGRAEAGWNRVVDRLQGGSYLHYELSGWTAIDDAAARMTAAPDDLVLAGVRLGGFVGRGATVGYHIAMDLFAGSTLGRAGFAYDVALYPVGVAVRFGATGFVGLATGVAASGAVGTIDDAVELPVALVAEAGRGWRLLGRARIGYIAGAASRQSGAPNVPFADELDAMIGLRIGHHYDAHGFPSGNGYFVGASYREQAGTRFAGLTIGYSLDVSLRRRFGSH